MITKNQPQNSSLQTKLSSQAIRSTPAQSIRHQWKRTNLTKNVHCHQVIEAKSFSVRFSCISCVSKYTRLLKLLLFFSKEVNNIIIFQLTSCHLILPELYSLLSLLNWGTRLAGHPSWINAYSFSTRQWYHHNFLHKGQQLTAATRNKTTGNPDSPQILEG